ncbi:MAG: hypothetical protein EOO90_10915 [Pedobacter sp.]|nr:MAG: hypothetical protein EOO90_10915 [Pedobacter sp.]
MQQPFDVEIGSVNYAIFPEGNNTYVVFKEGKEYLTIQKDSASEWIKMSKETGLPEFELDIEVNELGARIESYKEEPEEDEDQETEL